MQRVNLVYYTDAFSQFPIHIDNIWMVSSIIYFKGPQLEFSKLSHTRAAPKWAEGVVDTYYGSHLMGHYHILGAVSKVKNKKTKKKIS